MPLKVFNFACVNGHTFEAMVGSEEDFEKQKKAGLFTCPVCGSSEVKRALSAPHVKTQAADEVKNSESLDSLSDLFKAIHKILDDSEYVGDKFADEALAIKRGEAEERVISGTASQEEVEQLREEGVDVLQVPVVPKNKVN